MTEQEDSNGDSDHKVPAYEHQVITHNVSGSSNMMKPASKEEDSVSYLKMLRNNNTQNIYGYNSCVCVGCGTVFASPQDVASHWHRSPKCISTSEKQFCVVCKNVGAKVCKHYSPDGLMLVDDSQVVNFDTFVQSESNQNNFNSTNRENTYTPEVAKSYKYVQESEEKEICPLPPPPSNDPQKPLPYRIDFLLNSGVIKHARMNTGKNSNGPFYFEKKRPRKPRTHFTCSQVGDLEKVFEDKKYLSASERQTIAIDLNLQEEQVKNWFQNRRSRWRKDCKDSTQQNFDNITVMGNQSNCITVMPGSI